MTEKYDFGLVGLGVMGRNFILNVTDHGFSAIGLDTDQVKADALGAEATDKQVEGTVDKKMFIESLSRPRKIMLLVPAGAVVDAVIADLAPLLDKGDLLIDGGNSHFADTNRRTTDLQEKGIHFFGAGVSGGAKGARLGPSIMPGGDREAYKIIKPIFEAAAAKVQGDPCVDYIGTTSAGNYVKMVHNGIEYGLMQLISEIYGIMKNGVGLSNQEIGSTFSTWNEGRLQSFLVEITSEIFVKKDDLTNQDLVDVIMDKAKQKGTGKWTSQNGMDLGIAVPTIDSAVSMREISSLKEERMAVSKLYGTHRSKEKSGLTISDLENALYFAFIITYSQGMSQLAAASREYNYGLNLETISRIWRGGCIIRALLLEDMRVAFADDPGLTSMLLHSAFQAKLSETVEGVRKVIGYSVESEIPVMSLSASLQYFDAMKSARLPLNLIQAQRDHFGSHTYERLDKPGIFHTDW